MRDENLKLAIAGQREELTANIGRALFTLSHLCCELMSDRPALEEVLTEALTELSNCKHLFVLDRNGIQFVDNITPTGPDPKHFGRDRSKRPYVRNLAGTSDFLLSDAYISQNTRRPMLTAVQVIRDDNGMQRGYLGADFDLRELPATKALYHQSNTWRQIKGDPVIRRGLFAQERVQSSMDDHIDDILPLFYELMAERGAFHGELHFSSSRATVWLADDPFVYRLFEIDELIEPNICLAHPKSPYPDKAAVQREDIKAVLQMFRELRFIDETIYLRSGSLNLYNGLIGLNFSCDGTHYLSAQEFVERGIDFWLNEA